MSKHDDPNYAWDILSDEMADKLYELLDPIVDHKRDTTEACNKLADFVDEVRTSNWTVGAGQASRWHDQAVKNVTDIKAIERFRPDDVPQFQWLMCVIHTLHTSVDRAGGIPGPDAFFALVRLQHEAIYGKAATHG